MGRELRVGQVHRDVRQLGRVWGYMEAGWVAVGVETRTESLLFSDTSLASIQYR
jgi:hypothetical protein